MIIANNITKNYKGKFIFKNFNYTFNKGVYLISGKSGKGKTTLLNILSLFDNDFEGKVIVDGEIFYLRDFDNLVGELTIKEHFYLFEKVNGVSIKDIFNLGMLNKKAKKLSLGERQLVSITLALNYPCKNLLMDEPFSALSRENITRVCKFIEQLCIDKTIIISSHADFPIENVEIINLEKVRKRLENIYFVESGEIEKKLLKKEYLSLYYKKMFLRKVLFVFSIILVITNFIFLNVEMNSRFNNYLIRQNDRGVIISRKIEIKELNERLFYEVIKKISMYVEDYNANYYNSKLYSKDIKVGEYYIDNGFVLSSIKYIERDMKNNEIALGINYKKFCLDNVIGYCDNTYINSLLINKKIEDFPYYIDYIFESEETVFFSNNRFVEICEDSEYEEYYFDVKKMFSNNVFEIINGDDFLSNFDFILIGENEEYYRYEVLVSDSKYFTNIEYKNYLVCLEKGYNCFNYLNHFNNLLKIDEYEETNTLGFRIAMEDLKISEIVISSGLSKKLFKETNDKIVLNFKIESEVMPVELIIKDVIEDEGLYLYHNSKWSYYFYKDILKYGNEDLRIKNIVIYEDIKKGDYMSENIYESSIKELEQYIFEIKKSLRVISIITLIGNLIVIVFLELFQNKFKKDYFRYLKILNVKVKKEP